MFREFSSVNFSMSFETREAAVKWINEQQVKWISDGYLVEHTAINKQTYYDSATQKYSVIGWNASIGASKGDDGYDC